MTDITSALRRHQARLRACHRCPLMQGPPVVGQPVASPVLLVGQAPGPKEIAINRPFAWTAGKTLFKWFASIGLDEESFRRHVYMAAVCRCFPGKHPRGGDRVPNREETANCSGWLQRELELLRPRLILPVGKLAIAQFMDVSTLDGVVGHVWSWSDEGLETDLIPLPHPSGASTWHRTEPGRTLLAEALEHVRAHPAWRAVCAAAH